MATWHAHRQAFNFGCCSCCPCCVCCGCCAYCGCAYCGCAYCIDKHSTLDVSEDQSTEAQVSSQVWPLPGLPCSVTLGVGGWQGDSNQTHPSSSHSCLLIFECDPSTNNPGGWRTLVSVTSVDSRNIMIASSAMKQEC